jgi:hypothetical protein
MRGESRATRIDGPEVDEPEGVSAANARTGSAMIPRSAISAIVCLRLIPVP